MWPPIPRNLIAVTCVLGRLIERNAPGLIEQVRAHQDQRFRLKSDISRLERDIKRLPTPPVVPVDGESTSSNRLLEGYQPGMSIPTNRLLNSRQQEASAPLNGLNPDYIRQQAEDPAVTAGSTARRAQELEQELARGRAHLREIKQREERLKKAAADAVYEVAKAFLNRVVRAIVLTQHTGRPVEPDPDQWSQEPGMRAIPAGEGTFSTSYGGNVTGQLTLSREEVDHWLAPVLPADHWLTPELPAITEAEAEKLRAAIALLQGDYPSDAGARAVPVREEPGTAPGTSEQVEPAAKAVGSEQQKHESPAVSSATVEDLTVLTDGDAAEKPIEFRFSRRQRAERPAVSLRLQRRIWTSSI